MIPGVIESEITKIPLITHCVFGRHRPAYIRLMCGRFTSRLMWPKAAHVLQVAQLGPMHRSHPEAVVFF
jgi:hypothetical protein